MSSKSPLEHACLDTGYNAVALSDTQVKIVLPPPINVPDNNKSMDAYYKFTKPVFVGTHAAATHFVRENPRTGSPIVRIRERDANPR